MPETFSKLHFFLTVTVVYMCGRARMHIGTRVQVDSFVCARQEHL